MSERPSTLLDPRKAYTGGVSDRDRLQARVRAVEGRDLTLRTATRPWPELPATRAKAYAGPPCAWGEHRWVRFVDDADFVVGVLCGECGHMPTEALAQLAIGRPPAVPADP